MKNLSAANKLMIKIAETNKHLTPVTPDDLPLFQKFFQKEPHTYGNSWTYVTQGVYGIGPQNLGYKYYDGKNLSMVCVYPKIEQPKINVFYWIRPMGPNILDKILDISKENLSDYKLPTYVKKIFKNQFDYLKKGGFTDTKNFPWHTLSHTEDDSIPEQIFDVKKSLDVILTSPRSSLKRVLVNKDKLKANNLITFKKDGFKSISWKLADEFFKRNKKITNISNKFDYYNMIFTNQNRLNLSRYIVYVNNLPFGFYVVEKQNKEYSGFYALIVLREKFKFLADYIWLNIFTNLNTKYLNAGGSEDKFIHEFKQKFHPVNSNNMFWATNYSS